MVHLYIFITLSSLFDGTNINTFSEPIGISLEFDPAKFDNTPVIYTYEAGKWVRFDTRVEDNKAITKVTHFSTFVLFDEGEVVPTAAPTPTKAPGFEAVFAHFFASQKPLLKMLRNYEPAAVAYLVLRRKKR